VDTSYLSFVVMMMMMEKQSIQVEEEKEKKLYNGPTKTPIPVLMYMCLIRVTPRYDKTNNHDMMFCVVIRPVD